MCSLVISFVKFVFIFIRIGRLSSQLFSSLRRVPISGSRAWFVPLDKPWTWSECGLWNASATSSFSSVVGLPSLKCILRFYFLFIQWLSAVSEVPPPLLLWIRSLLDSDNVGYHPRRQVWIRTDPCHQVGYSSHLR